MTKRKKIDHMRLTFLNIVLLFLALVFAVSGQTVLVSDTATAPTKVSKQQFLPLKDVREGMKGTAYTVFRGTKAEPFNVEILGVMPGGIGPGQDMIIGTISGGGAERTKVFAGMSGSPVYIDGKLVGAVSYAFPFSTEAICGITPIEQMVSMFEEGSQKNEASGAPKIYSFAELTATEWEPDYSFAIAKTVSVPTSGGTGTSLNGISGQSFIPIATPLSFSGFSPKTLDQFAPQLAKIGMMPVTGISSGSSLSRIKEADETTLVGGDSVAVELTRGDFSIAANGTVTWRDGERVYAFGHPFLSLGSSALPMSESSVVIVVPSINNSFKMSVSESLVGSMTQDLATGIYGSLGTVPKMIPVTLNLQTSRNRRETLHYEIANDDFLTPLLINMTLYNALTANERGIGDLTISIDGKIDLENSEPINIAGRFGGQSSVRLATNAVVVPAFNLMQSKFDNLSIKGINLDITSYDGSKAAVLQRMTVDRSRAKPGDTVQIEAFIRTESGKILSQKIPFKIPADTPYGKLKLALGDGSMMQMNSAEEQFEPKNLADLVSTINKLKKSDRLYLQARRITTGAIIGSSELPSLPPSVLATLNTSRTSSVYKPTVASIIADLEIPLAEFIISGQQELEITVVD